MRKINLVDKNILNEKGAALVMVLMVSALLMVACVAMLTAAAMNTRNVTDAVAEESGRNSQF